LDYSGFLGDWCCGFWELVLVLRLTVSVVVVAEAEVELLAAAAEAVVGVGAEIGGSHPQSAVSGVVSSRYPGG